MKCNKISMKHETAGTKASSFKTIQLMTEKIMQREKDRAESRKDRKGLVKSQLWPKEAKETAPMSSSTVRLRLQRQRSVWRLGGGRNEEKPG